MDEVFNGAEILRMRRELLLKMDAFASDYLEQLTRREHSRWDFYYFVSFCNPAVFDILNWEQVSPRDIASCPNIARLIHAACVAAKQTQSSFDSRDSSGGKRGRRSFAEIGHVVLAINMLPRLQSILQRWGIPCEYPYDDYVPRELTAEENELLDWSFTLR